MKCDELKPIYIVEGYEQNPNLGKFTRPTILRYDILAYRKDDVDAAIAELKAENRKLQRALYKTLANWAHFAVAFFSSYATKERWYKMERKCRAKSEGYK